MRTIALAVVLTSTLVVTGSGWAAAASWRDRDAPVVPCSAATTVALNRALGKPVGICQGKTLPRGPFVMTLALALEPAGSPVTPAPDLTVPTVGALPRC